MSVKFILGRGGSGKSTYMLDKIQERVQDNETSPVILLLPEQYTFEMEKNRLVNYSQETRKINI